MQGERTRSFPGFDEDLVGCLLETAGDLVMVTGAAGEVLYLSPSCERVIGHEPGDLLGRRPQIVHHEDLPTVREAQRRGLACERGSDLRYRIHTPDGHTRWMSHSWTPLCRDGRTRVVVNVVRDVTEASAFDENLQAQKMEAIATLAAGVSHDMNNVMTNILGQTELAFREIGRDDPLAERLEEIRGSVEQAVDLTRQLLILGGRHPFEPRPLQPATMLLAMEDELERVLGPEVTLTLEPDDDPWTVHCDREGLERLVLNLALNAREAMPGGGSLRIGAANVGEAMAGARRPQEARPGPYVCLTFEDTGGGMDPEVRRRMFEPFFTTKGAGLGNGLGLAVVHGIVTHHGGWIDVESERGRGTAIRVHLPARTGAVFLEEERPAGGRRAGGAARILVVEDDDGARRFAVRALERAGYEVTAARDVSGALLHLAGGRRFDLVFSDLVLPDGDGARLVEQIVDREPDVGVVLTSGCARDGGTLQRIRDRRWTFLQKPYALGALVEAVRKNVPRR